MVHPCDKPCGNKTASGYCATTVCINPQYSNLGTAQYGQGVKKRIVTNADRIRSMTDEELAGQISEWNHGDCPPIELCPKRRNESTHYVECTPWKCWLDWLKKEVSE